MARGVGRGVALLDEDAGACPGPAAEPRLFLRIAGDCGTSLSFSELCRPCPGPDAWLPRAEDCRANGSCSLKPAPLEAPPAALLDDAALGAAWPGEPPFVDSAAPPLEADWWGPFPTSGPEPGRPTLPSAPGCRPAFVKCDCFLSSSICFFESSKRRRVFSMASSQTEPSPELPNVVQRSGLQSSIIWPATDSAAVMRWCTRQAPSRAHHSLISENYHFPHSGEIGRAHV